MCFGGGPDKDEEAAAQKNREIDKALRADEKKASKEVKLLLLGELAMIVPVTLTATDTALLQVLERVGSRRSSSRCD